MCPQLTRKIASVVGPVAADTSACAIVNESGPVHFESRRPVWRYVYFSSFCNLYEQTCSNVVVAVPRCEDVDSSIKEDAECRRCPHIRFLGEPWTLAVGDADLSSIGLATVASRTKAGPSHM